MGFWITRKTMEKGVLRAEHVAVLFGQTDKQAILVTVWV